MCTRSDAINEIQIYKSFFSENSRVYNIGYKNYMIRSWHYYCFEDSFLASLKVMDVEDDDGYIYDYSSILNTKIDDTNYKDFANIMDVKMYKLSEISLSKLKEILKNNALAANIAKKIEQTVTRYKKMKEMFD